MKLTNLKYLSLLVIALAGILLSSCEEPDVIGLNVQPPGDQLNLAETDTISLITYTVREDSLRSDETTYALLGSYLDPVFGLHSASFYSQIRLSSNNTSFGSNPQADSIVLTLVYNAAYGDTLTPQTVKVYELIESIDKDSSYYSNDAFTIGSLLASKAFVPAPLDSVKIDGVKKAPHLRIKLEPSLAQRFIDASGSTSLSNNSNFLDFFKGIFVTTDPVNSKGAILSFDLLNSLSQVTMYYKNDNADSLKYNFVINENCARINHFNHHNYSQASSYLQSQLSGDTTKGDSILYLQSMAGLKVKIKYPYLMNLVANGKIAINKAELIVKLDKNDFTENEFAPPALLTVLEEQDGKIRYILDQYEGTNYFGGSFNKTKYEYRFNIARHIQQILDGEKDNLGLSLVVWTANRSNTANRVVLNGSKRSDALRLSITYTKLY